MLEASHAFLITDDSQPDNPIIDANSAFTAMTGYARSEILGRNCRFLQGPGTDPAAIDVLRQAIAVDRPQTVTLLNYRRDRSAFWNEVTVSPLRDPDGQGRYYVGIQRDVTVRRQAEDLSQSLETERSRIEFTTSIMQTLRHELKSPLSIICGYTELLLDARTTPITADQSADLALILQSGQHLERLLTSMLDLAQLQVGTLEFTFDDVAFLPLLGRLQAEFAPRAAVRQVKFHMSAPRALGPIHMDAVRLYQALTHVLDNAVRFTDAGVIALRVKETPGWLVIEIADTGRGMTADTLARLFTGLSPGEHGLRREFGGLGIGSALAAGFIAGHGGTITAESVLGSGTTVTIALPYAGKARAA